MAEDVFGKRLRELRKARGLTMDNLAEVIGLTAPNRGQTVASWEKGTREPKISTLKLLAEALGVTIDELVGYTPGIDTPAGKIVSILGSFNPADMQRVLRMLEAYAGANKNEPEL